MGVNDGTARTAGQTKRGSRSSLEIINANDFCRHINPIIRSLRLATTLGYFWSSTPPILHSPKRSIWLSSPSIHSPVASLLDAECSLCGIINIMASGLSLHSTMLSNDIPHMPLPILAREQLRSLESTSIIERATFHRRHFYPVNISSITPPLQDAGSKAC